MFFFFFFQAEDGIRDWSVTGVQTCALPIFEQTLRNGVFVSAGDFDGDGFADLVAGGGPGGGPRVLILSGKDLSGGNLTSPTAIANFFAGDDNRRGGVRVTAKD